MIIYEFLVQIKQQIICCQGDYSGGRTVSNGVHSSQVDKHTYGVQF